jgi:preprotein translocase subunit SecG
MYTFLVVVHVITCTVLVITVLLQQGKGAEIGAVFGSSEAVFGSTGPATLLSKVTTVSAVVFMLTSLSLTYLSIHSRGESVMRKVQQAPVVPAQMPSMPAAPGADQEAGKAPVAAQQQPAAPVANTEAKVQGHNGQAAPQPGKAGSSSASDAAPVSKPPPAGAGSAAGEKPAAMPNK